MHFRNRRRRNKIGSSQRSSNAGQMMNLSLFIMLLAFFIVLNSVSSYEEIRAEKVRRSLTMAFSKEDGIKEEKSSTTENVAQALREGHTFDRLDALFRSQISAFDSTKSKSRGIMMVQVPVEEFTTAIMKVGQKDLLQYPTRRAIRGNFFLPTLVSLLRTNIDGAPTRMEILVNNSDNPARLQNESPASMKRMMTLVTTYSNRLEKQGMPEKLINIGVKKGDPQYVDLVFRKYIPFSPVSIDGEKVE